MGIRFASQAVPGSPGRVIDRRLPQAVGIHVGKNGEMTGQLSVALTLAFYPRGGSAQVVRYLGRALQSLGNDVTVCCGSLGPPGAASHAATFFDGLPVQALDFTETVAWFEDGRDPMAAPVPIHPSFEDRPGVPDRVFASIGTDAYERQVAIWQTLLNETGAPDVYHVHHLSHVNDAVDRVDRRPVVAHLHGTELKMLEDIRTGAPDRWSHAEEWDRRLVAAAHRADRVIVISPTDRQLAVDLLGLDPGRIEIVPNGVDTTVFAPSDFSAADRLAQWRRWLVDDPQGWDESGEPGTIASTNEDVDRAFVEPGTGGLRPVLLFVGRFLDFKRVPLPRSVLARLLFVGNDGVSQARIMDREARFAERVGEDRLRMLLDVVLQPVPDRAVVADLLTMHADRDQPLELLDV